MASGASILLPPRDRPPLIRYGFPLTAFGVALYVRSLMPWLLVEAPYAFLLPIVFISAWCGGLRMGLAVTLSAAVIGTPDFVRAITFQDQGEASSLVLFTANSCIIAGLCAAVHRAIERSRTATDEAARNFAIMANNAPVLIWLSRPDGSCPFVNRQWVKFTGRSEEPHGRRPGQIHPADATRYQAVATEAAAARKPFQIEYRLRRADDCYRWLHEQAVPRFDRSGRFEGYIGSCNDVTEARNEREELALIARLQSSLTESLDLGKCADALAGSLVPRLADWCSILLVNDAGELEPIRTARSDRRAATPSRSSELARRIVQQGDTLSLYGPGDEVLRTVAADDAHADALRHERELTYLGVPLRAHGTIIGVLAIATFGGGRSLGADEHRMVQKIAAIAGFALENARLYRSARRALAAEKHALHEVEKMEQRFRFIWDANIFGIGTVAPTGRLLTANTALATLLDYSPECIERGEASINERTAPGWRAADLRAGDELLRTGRCAPFEKEYMRQDGTKVQVLVCGMVLPNSEECLMFVLDLSAQKHAERALDRQGMLLTTIIEAMPAMVGYVGLDERFRMHNEKCRQWLGAGDGGVDGRSMAELIGESAYHRIGPYLQAALRGRNMHHECRLEAGGRERHLIASYRPDRDEHGRVCGVVMHAYDISERREAEQALAEALMRYRFLADAMPQMVWTAAPNGQLDYVNRRWLETTGMTEAASLAPDGWLDAVHFEDREATRDHWHRCVAARTPFEHECRLRCGKSVTWRWHLVRALPRRDDYLTLVQWVGSATDIDEQRRAYAELAEARERLKTHTEELEARVRARTATLREANAELEAFTYSVSHDLRTPLHFMRGFAEAIQPEAEAKLSAENRDFLRRIVRAAARMESIIQDLLSYSRLARSEIQLVEIPLDDVVADVLAHHHAMIRETGATVVVDQPLPRVCADRTGLFQAISNLVSNALKFSRPGESPSIYLRAEPTDHGVRLWIEDNGIGIDPRHHERIFQLFERLHSQTEYPGTGIGLSLVRKAVRRMGGDCGVESAPEAGSRFWIDFPDACPVTRAEQNVPA